ncbi:MAG: sigma-54-dependent Fis family transcriptional regulator [Planctomycetes bacterium]|nr:sigma-54-dependent Fis family transcriptional regulator [Planctomycetota bacterium]
MKNLETAEIAALQVLLAEDERTIAVTLRDALESAGHAVTALADGRQALEALAKRAFDVVVTDVRMPGASGLDVLKAARAQNPPCEVLVITGYGTIEQAVEAMRLGAFSYLQKPFLNEAVVSMVGEIDRRRNLEIENRRLAGDLAKRPAGDELIAGSPAMAEVFKRIDAVAKSDVSVLIVGESGTGKERIARAVHNKSKRASMPFVPLSCAALAETLLESELFGHEKGAFTDAHREKRGRFELAQGGTIFLDDVDDLALSTQVKLLRVLQERTLERLGSEKSIRVDVRVIAATKVPLDRRVREGRFREDLYYRLNVVPIVVPPLREREGDVRRLTDHFLSKYDTGRRTGSERRFQIYEEDYAWLEKYSWPGNVRELEHAVQRAIALAPENATYLRREHLVPMSSEYRSALEPPEKVSSLREVLNAAERGHLERVLKLTLGRRLQAADLLGISRKVLWEKIRDHGIDTTFGKSPGQAGEPEDEEP